ncbi:MAG: cadmium-translocating P-type ATPase [Caulobacterales bacterium]|nr:cadmium-translocating P-type ATPase [Caulobacterales bacterium]
MSLGDEIRLASRDLGSGRLQTELSVPGARCAGCISKIETGLTAVPGVESARMNLTARRASVIWRGETAPDLIAALDRVGFQAHLAGVVEDTRDPELGRLVRALAVAGFGAMNIMLLSVSVWSGADDQTRQIFHWISAAIAFPCLIYAGRIFYESAWAALRRGRTNMDVPISIGVTLAFALSLYDTVLNERHAYFDAAISLLFFLLIGRTLDHLMRNRARTAISGLARLVPRGATVLHDDGRREHLPVEQIAVGMRLLIATGDRVPVDAVVEEGRSELDCAIATGESAPRAVEPGSPVQAGTLNLMAPLTLRATARADASFLAEILRLMQAAEGGRAAYRRVADRAASLYAPVVHVAALLTFLGWMLASGDWHRAITVAIAVLIITCPCALGLAVPMVQVTAARRLFDAGIMVKDGAGLERLAQIDTVVFDKTGTLTLGQPRLMNAGDISSPVLAVAGALAGRSRHPASRAIAAVAPPSSPPLQDVKEHPGLGIEARIGEDSYRLGRSEWAVNGTAVRREGPAGPVLSRNGQLLASFSLQDTLRPGALQTIQALQEAGLPIILLSGDEPEAVEAVARRLGLTEFAARLLPGDKVARLEVLAAEGRRVLMVGDGLNDAPALSAAHASMTPADAADVGRAAADFVFLHPSLEAVPNAVSVAREARRLVHQNFALSIGYNVLALPIAVLGLVTPLIAALAMSTSSIIVVANALRLRSADRMRASSTPVQRISPPVPSSMVEVPG